MMQFHIFFPTKNLFDGNFFVILYVSFGGKNNDAQYFLICPLGTPAFLVKGLESIDYRIMSTQKSFENS